MAGEGEGEFWQEGQCEGRGKWQYGKVGWGTLRLRTAVVDFSAVSGRSPLPGVNGVVHIPSGSSTALAVRNAIRVGLETVETGVNPRIEEALAAIALSAPSEV